MRFLFFLNSFFFYYRLRCNFFPFQRSFVVTKIKAKFWSPKKHIALSETVFNSRFKGTATKTPRKKIVDSKKGFVQSLELNTFTINRRMWYGFMCLIWIANIKRVSFYSVLHWADNASGICELGWHLTIWKSIAHAKINRAWKQFLLINCATDNNFYCANEWSEFKLKCVSRISS